MRTSLRAARLLAIALSIGACRGEQEPECTIAGYGVGCPRIDPSSPHLFVGQSLQFGVTGGWTAAGWTSSDEDVATISSSGLATAHAPGRTRISAIAEGSPRTILEVHPNTNGAGAVPEAPDVAIIRGSSESP